MLIGDLLRRNARLFPTRAAWRVAGRTATWETANRAVNAASHALLGLGVRPHERVAVLVADAAHFAELHFALAKVGMVAVPFSARLSGREAVHLLRDVAAAAALVDAAYAPVAEAARSQLPTLRHWLGIGAGHRQPEDLAALAARASAEEPVVALDEQALWAIQYTDSGRGVPRGCMASHRQLLQSVLTYASLLPLYPDDVCLPALPPSTGVGAHLLTAYALAAALTVFPAAADPATLLQAIAQEHVTRVFLLPAQLDALLAQVPAGTRALASLRLVGRGGGPTAPATVERAVAQLGAQRLYHCYGTGETGGFVAYLLPEDHAGRGDEAAAPRQARWASCGREAPFARLRIADAEGREVPPGAVGELLVRADTVTAGYWGQPEETARLLRDGWLHTDELAMMDAEGYLSLVDRKLEITLDEGVEVLAPEAEAVLRAHPAVDAAAVIEVPDAYWGQSLKALVVLRPGATVSAAELLAYCRAALGAYQPPHRLELLAPAPQAGATALLRRELRERYWHGLLGHD